MPNQIQYSDKYFDDTFEYRYARRGGEDAPRAEELRKEGGKRERREPARAQGVFLSSSLSLCRRRFSSRPRSSAARRAGRAPRADRTGGRNGVRDGVEAPAG